MRKRIAFGVFALIIVCLAYFIIAVLPISTGYAAKNLCSCLFVSGYSQAFAEENDLNFSLVGMSKNTVDTDKQTVTSTFFGLAKRTAVYRGNGFGCTLLADDDTKIKAIPESRSNNTAKEKLVGDSVVVKYTDTISTTLSTSRLQKIDSILLQEINNPATSTRALLVMHSGKIVGERYAEPFDSNSVFIAWSMTKSITATFIGHFVQEGKININDPVPISHWKDDPIRSQITWKHLLQMNSGLKWKELYSWRSTASRMLYMENDVFDFASQATAEYPPGTYWEYSSGTSNILSGLIRQVLNDDVAYHNLPSDVLINPIRMSSLVIETDPAGNFIGSSYSYATARDWGKYGQLYLQNGNWNGQQILPPDWSSFVAEVAEGSQGRYGAHFWLNADGHMPDVPKDAYFADGFMGQRVMIIPSESLVVVRLGTGIHRDTDMNALAREIVGIVNR